MKTLEDLARKVQERNRTDGRHSWSIEVQKSRLSDRFLVVLRRAEHDGSDRQVWDSARGPSLDAAAGELLDAATTLF